MNLDPSRVPTPDAELLALLALFAEAHPEFATVDGADGCCGLATDLFIEMAEALNVGCPMEELHFTSRRLWAAEFRHPELREGGIPCFHYSKGPPLFHGGLSDHMGHIVVRVGELCVDWTARQFRPDAPFPFVFSVPTP